MRPHLLRSFSLIQACCYAFQISGTLLLNAKPLTSRANLKMKKSIMNSTSFHQSEWWSLCLETSKIIPLPNFLLTNKKIQQNDAALLKMGQQKPACPKKNENHPAIQSELDSPSVDLLNTKQAQETGWMHQVFLPCFNNNKKSQVEQIAGISIQMIFSESFSGENQWISIIHPSPKLIRAPKSCWVYVCIYIYISVRICLHKHIQRNKPSTSPKVDR